MTAPLEGHLARLLAPWRGTPPVGDDWALWQRAIDGHAASARRLVEHLTPTALGLALQLLGGRRAAAEDAVQDAFLRLWRSRPRDTGQARLSTYFNTIVLNRCRSQLAADQRECSTDPDDLREQLDRTQLDPASGGAGPSNESDDHSGEARFDGPLGAHLADALQALPSRQRMALAMWACADASVAEIAQSLRIDSNAAHQLLHRAKAALRRRVQPAHGDRTP